MHGHRMLVVFLVVFLLTPSLHGQAARPPARADPPAVTHPPDPREQRAAREQAVAVVGEAGREFVERYGDDAVAAISVCSQPVAVRLVEFHAAGGLAKLPRPRTLLRVIGTPGHGDEVASWAMAHAGELASADAFDAYVLDPLSYALALKTLEDGAAEVREHRRLAYDYLTQRAEWWAYSWRMFGLGAGVSATVLLLAWRYRQRYA